MDQTHLEGRLECGEVIMTGSDGVTNIYTPMSNRALDMVLHVECQKTEHGIRNALTLEKSVSFWVFNHAEA